MTTTLSRGSPDYVTSVKYELKKFHIAAMFGTLDIKRNVSYTTPQNWVPPEKPPVAQPPVKSSISY
jgi:hypothetical protein